MVKLRFEFDVSDVVNRTVKKAHKMAQKTNVELKFDKNSKKLKISILVKLPHNL